MFSKIARLQHHESIFELYKNYFKLGYDIL